jgi:hypothetical protein
VASSPSAARIRVCRAHSNASPSRSGLQVHRREDLGPAAGQDRPPLDALVGDDRAHGGSIPPHGAHREGAAEAGYGPERVVDRQPGVDAPHPVDERDRLDAVVDPRDRRPPRVLDGLVDRALGGGQFGRVERCAVGRRPALDEDPRHTRRILPAHPDTWVRIVYVGESEDVAVCHAPFS